MKIRTVTICAVAALAAANVAANVYGQQRSDVPQAQAPAAAANVSDAELDTFATIYVDLMQTVAKFEPQMKLAQSEEQQQEIRTQMQEESVAKVAQRGWTAEKFNTVTDAINRDQGLADKAAKLIDEKS